ncbi:MAG: BamA/TamA family outer membrane protein [Bacteroidetes bacterium]|nr:BamA/TamA family outer membrane protein [Fibrella sp.]
MNLLPYKPLLLGWLLLGLPSVGQAQMLPADTVAHRLILVGDAGRLHNGKNAVIDAVAARYSLDNDRTTLLYLGDNIYPRGMPQAGIPTYDRSVAVLRYQVAPALGKKSNVILIPGNHDWDNGGKDGWNAIKRQGDWLKNLSAPNIRLLPANGCPGPDEVPLGNNMVLITFDSQLVLHPYGKPGSDSDCECKTEAEFRVRLAEILYRNRGKAIVVATHHPFRSYGVHGGYYTIRQHLFPLTEIKKNLYLPLPVIGSIYPLGRGRFGNIQDLRHPLYQRMVNGVERITAKTPDLVFVAGHEHSLQHIIDRGRHYIVSGSGTNRERVKKGPLAEFVSSDWGYVVVEQTNKGVVRAYFHTAKTTGQDSLAYTTTLMRVAMTRDTVTLAQSPVWPATKTAAVGPRYDRFGRFHRLLLGENYRKEWAAPVTMPVFDISRAEGGMKILQRGGGMQTKSLRLQDSSGREWVLRAVQKDVSNALPGALRQTIVRAVAQDQVSAAHPFGPLVVPALAEAAGVLHASPTLVYVPDDPALGEYRADFANTVCMLEERSPDDADKSVSTEKVLAKLADDTDNQVDQRAVLRARLLDMLIGDWDRHDDQWRWQVEKTAEGSVYVPIPRDRDQVFFRSGGPMPGITALPWFIPKFQGFRKKLANVNGFNFNARHFDRTFLNELSREDWQTITAEVQQAVTDEVITNGIAQLPEPIRRLSGPRLRASLLTRRTGLVAMSRDYYRFLAKAVDIPGTDKRESVTVNHRADGQTEVSVHKIAKDSAVTKQVYHRVFDPATTREIRLYGRGGNDRFVSTGTPAKGLNVRLIGGEGADDFRVDRNNAPRNRTIIYDRSTEKNTLATNNQARIHLAADTAINTYNRTAFVYDRLAPLLSGGYNYDDGLRLGLGVVYTKQAFRKSPFAARHRLLAGYSFATGAFAINYSSQFTHVIGRNDLLISVGARAPSNVTNFFGLGNETVFDRREGRNIRYYRTRYDVVDAAVLLKRAVGRHGQLLVGPVFQYYNLNLADNQGRFISLYRQTEARPGFARPVDLATRRVVGGLQAGFVIDTRNSNVLPTQGLLWTNTLKGMQGLDDRDNHLLQLRLDLAVYTRLSALDKVVLLNRIGGGLTRGEPAYYQMHYLGGTTNLRGYRNFRFAGEQMVYHNLELRVKLFDFASILFPGTVRLELFNDVGRVWVRDLTSRTLHHGYGGGLSVTPFNRVIIRGLLGVSQEGVLPYFNFGYQLQF